MKTDKIKIGVVAWTPRQFKDLVLRLEHADLSLKRFVEFVYVDEYEKTRGVNWRGYIRGHLGNEISDRNRGILREFESRGVKELELQHTTKGPLIVKFQNRQLMCEE